MADKKDGPGWIAIQGSVFLNWVNMQFEKVGLERTEDLATCFSKGASLIKVLETVCEKKVGKKYKENPNSKIHEIENLNIAFNFMEAEGVKLVNIGPEDIHSGALKLVLGLIWTIIYNFQVIKGFNKGAGKKPKDVLLEWIQSKIPEQNVTNFTSDWRDGKAICALSNAIGKELYGDDETLVSDIGDDALKNATQGVAAGKKKLAVPDLLSAENLIDENCDEHSMIAYLSMFREARIPSADESGADEEEEPVAIEAEIKEVAAASGDKPWERPATWREYSGPDLGGRLKIRVYFSTTTSSLIIRKNTEAMMRLLEAKKVHQRPDFEPMIPIDMDMEKEKRNQIFEKAGQRETPMLFIDDEFVGGYDTVVELNEIGELDRLLAY
eukprot:m.335546 g.335546  ORF g.335546 m.335546 type:complete len:383 (-) comp17625_c0_seq1:300-1448(-)